MVSSSLRLVRELGVGGMGHVWVADHLVLRHQVAVKFLAPDLVRDPKAIARFSRETAAAAEVRSDHVVETLDHGVDSDGIPYIVMELLNGCDLATLLQRQRALPPAKVVSIVCQVAEALGRAHERGVIHRDVKPSNIFLVDPESDDPHVKVLDFGIARSMAADAKETTTGVVLGTVHYMSPEQVIGNALDHRTDIWSLGVVAFEAMTGTIPFDAPAVGSLALAIHTQRFPMPSERMPQLGMAFDEWMSRACARERDARFGSMRELRSSIMEVSSSGPEHRRVVQVHADARPNQQTVEVTGEHGQVLVPFQDPVVPVRSVRSTLLLSSMRVLRERGLVEAYKAALPSEHRDALTVVVAGEWLPIDIATAHYAALDTLGFSPLEAVSIGRDVSRGFYSQMLSTAVAAARRVGFTPWTVLRHTHRFYGRAFDGGGVRIWKVGDREMFVEVREMPLARIAYWRHALRGLWHGGLEVLGVRPFVRLMPQSAPDSAEMRIVWS